MQTNLNGAIEGARLGSVKVAHSFLVELSTMLPAVDYLLCKIPGTPERPVFVQVRAVIQTASNAVTTGTLTVGTTASDNDILDAVDLKAAANVVYTDIVPVRVITVLTPIFAVRNHTGGDQTAGKAWVLVEVWESHPELDEIRRV